MVKVEETRTYGHPYQRVYSAALSATRQCVFRIDIERTQTKE